MIRPRLDFSYVLSIFDLYIKCIWNFASSVVCGIAGIPYPVRSTEHVSSILKWASPMFHHRRRYCIPFQPSLQQIKFV